MTDYVSPAEGKSFFHAGMRPTPFFSVLRRFVEMRYCALPTGFLGKKTRSKSHLLEGGVCSPGCVSAGFREAYCSACGLDYERERERSLKLAGNAGLSLYYERERERSLKLAENAGLSLYYERERRQTRKNGVMDIFMGSLSSNHDEVVNPHFCPFASGYGMAV